MQPLIEIDNLYKIYNPGENEVRALDGISLNIYNGEFVAIIGYSGSGKSTLMNMIGCLDVPSSGTYKLNNTDVSSLNDDQLSEIRNRQVGFVFQSFNLIQSLSAFGNVELPLIYRGIPAPQRKPMVMKALNHVGLGDRVNHKPSEMSGGQQQRVAVARALAGEPPLILADEPTGNLDRGSGEQVFSIIKELHKDGNTIVLITHDDELAKKAERMIRIVDGKIVN